MRKTNFLLFCLIFIGGCSGGTQNSEAGRISFSTQLMAALKARFTSGNVELRKSFEAKKVAKSWRMRTEMRLHPGDPLVTISEVSCPDRQKLTTIMHDVAINEAYRIGPDVYTKGEKGWQKQPLRSDAYPCGVNTGYPAPWAMLNEGRDAATALSMLSETAKPTVKVGRLIELDGAPCQQWDISFGHPGKGGIGSGIMTYNVCIDYYTHYPKRISTSNGNIIITYYDWNQPINIAPPAS
jgi:hypothetical protein